jgi:hypothetical protein
VAIFHQFHQGRPAAPVEGLQPKIV